MNDALARRVIEFAKRLLDLGLRHVRLAFCQSQASVLDGGASAAARDTVVLLLALRAADALDC